MSNPSEPSFITSPQNPTVKALVRMRKRRERDECGCFLIDGHRALTLALAAGIAVTEVFMATDASLDEEAAVTEACRAGAVLTELAPPAFAKAAYGNGPDRLIAVAEQPQVGLNALSSEKTAPLYALVEQVEKPGNLGAILRSADAAGVDGVIVCDPATDLFNPNVVRASRGTLFSLPIAVVGLDDALLWLSNREIPILAALPDGQQCYTDTELCGPVALAVGAEHGGISPALTAAAGATLTIPMAGSADSLNVATSLALLLFEAVRQRGR